MYRQRNVPNSSWREEFTMALSWFAWRSNDRIQRAQNNKPAMRPGDKGAAVVTAVDIEALRVHFRLLMPGATIGSAVARTATVTDLTRIRDTFQRILGVLGSAATAFTDGVPFTGVKNPAESVPNSRRILF